MNFSPNAPFQLNTRFTQPPPIFMPQQLSQQPQHQMHSPPQQVQSFSKPSFTFPIKDDPLSPQTPPQVHYPQQDYKISTNNHFGDASTQLLSKLQSLYATNQEHLQKMKQLQKHVLLNPQTDTFQMLNSQQEELKKQIDFAVQNLNNLQQTTILAPHDIRKSFYLQQELQVQSMQLELYHQELQQLLLQPGMPARWYLLNVM